MKKNILLTCSILTIVFIFFCSCSIKNANSKKSVLPDTLLNHFPKNDGRLKLEYEMTNSCAMDAPYVPIEFEIIYLVRGYKCSDKEDKETLEKEITNKAIDTFYSTDTTYFAICAEEDMRDGHDSIELKKELSKHANDKCILGFTGVFHNHPTLIYDKTNCKLPVDYKLYLLKYGDTFLLPKEYKTEWTVLPKTKRHGYSCGVAISDKNDSFIFWTVAW